MNFQLHRKYMYGYKKNTISLLMAITLTITLFVALFILFHTNYSVQVKENQFIYSAIDYQVSGINRTQIEAMNEDKGLEHLGVSRNSGLIYSDNKQNVSLIEANEDEILAVSVLTEGRIPLKSDEIAAEKWALLNLGINPVIGDSITLNVDYMDNNNFQEKREVTFTLVGILKDMNFSKRAGIISLYTALGDNNSNDYIASLKYKEDQESSMQRLKANLKLSSGQVKKNPWGEEKKELLKWDIEMGLVLGIIFVVILYGVFRIFFTARESQYGILKAIGAKDSQIYLLIFRELFEVYLISVPIGICTGVLGAYLVTLISKEREIEIYFWGIKEEFQMVYPIPQLILGIGFIGIVIAVISWIFAHRINNKTIISTINGVEKSSYTKLSRIPTIKKKRIKNIENILGLRYLNSNISSTVFLFSSIVLVICLFYGLGYKATLEKTNNTIGKELNFYNSDYIITSNDDMRTDMGIKESTFQSIKNIKGIASTETQRAIPIKVFEDGIQKNEEFLAPGEELVKNNYGFSLTNDYNGRSVFLTKLKGYSENALTKLRKFIVDGEYNPKELKENEVIIAMPRTIEEGARKGITGFFKEGKPIMNYEIGDKIEIAFLKSFDTNIMSYWECSDSLDDYELMELKVAAVVYYPYMKVMSPLEQNYPLFIVSEKQFSEWIPSNVYESINIELNEDPQLGKEDIEKQLIELAVKNEQIAARSMIEEKKSLDTIYHKTLVYIYGISIVTFVLMLIHLVNNFQYRIYIRKNELGIYRAIGMNKKGVLKMVTSENRLLCLLALLISFALTYLLTLILFKRSGLSLYGIAYEYNYMLYIILFAAALAACEVITRKIVKKQNENSIIAIINDNE